MNTLIVILSVVVISLAVVFNYRKSGMMRKGDYQYYKVKQFMDEYEQDLFHTLTALYNDKYLIFVKPRVEDVLRVKSGLTRKERFTLRAHIKSRHTDFLLCDRKTTEPIIAIELDGSSHNGNKRKKRDQMMDGIYASAGMVLIHIPISKRFDNIYLTKSLYTKESVTLS